MHLLAHAGSTGSPSGRETVAHTHVVHAEKTAQEAGVVTPPAVASDGHGNHGFWGTAELGLCAAIIGCCTLLAVRGRWLHRRRFASFLQIRQRIQAAWSILLRPPRPRHSRGLHIAQLAVLRI
jgi:hypothetical protein